MTEPNESLYRLGEMIDAARARGDATPVRAALWLALIESVNGMISEARRLSAKGMLFHHDSAQIAIVRLMASYESDVPGFIQTTEAVGKAIHADIDDISAGKVPPIDSSYLNEAMREAMRRSRDKKD